MEVPFYFPFSLWPFWGSVPINLIFLSQWPVSLYHVTLNWSWRRRGKLTLFLLYSKRTWAAFFLSWGRGLSILDLSKGNLVGRNWRAESTEGRRHNRREETAPMVQRNLPWPYSTYLRELLKMLLHGANLSLAFRSWQKSKALLGSWTSKLRFCPQGLGSIQSSGRK